VSLSVGIPSLSPGIGVNRHGRPPLFRSSGPVVEAEIVEDSSRQTVESRSPGIQIVLRPSTTRSSAAPSLLPLLYGPDGLPRFAPVQMSGVLLHAVV
jgi:hypothetical protein